MNYYAFHIGDYAAATRHLTDFEDLAYRRLIDLYYSSEAPITLDRRQVYRLVRACTDDMREAIDIVLGEFFDEREDGWHHNRCDEEIAKAQEKSAKAKANGKLGGKASGKRTLDETEANAPELGSECKAPNPNPNPNPNPSIALASDTSHAQVNASDGQDGTSADPPHWEQAQSLLRDRADDIDHWEADFLHSIKWLPDLTKPQRGKLAAIVAKAAAPSQLGAALPSVKRGSPQYAAWIEHYRATKGRADFYERLEAITVPSEWPPGFRPPAETAH